MAMVVIEFGGLKELADMADNYHTNINKLYGNFHEFMLAIDKVVQNIIILMYAHYIDWWPINGACVGNRVLLMQSMLEFTFIYGCYCRRKRQLKCFNPVADDPRLSVKALMKDDEEEIRRADMFRMFKTGMDIMGDADSTLYAEPSSMAQVYDMMYAGVRDIGLLLPLSRKTKKETSDIYKQERMELLRKILSYKDCRKMDCGIVMPTCLRMLTLVLPSSECMRRYHSPHLQGLFAHKYPENGFGFVQPRGDLRDSIVLPDFRQLPDLATEALQTLSREDATPRPSQNASTDTETTTHVHRLCMQPRCLIQMCFDKWCSSSWSRLVMVTYFLSSRTMPQTMGQRLMISTPRPCHHRGELSSRWLKGGNQSHKGLQSKNSLTLQE